MKFTLDDVLKDLHKGFWWEFTDWDNRIYANLRVNEDIDPDTGERKFDYTLPTEEELNALINQNQTEYDAQEYARNRQAEYPSVGDQLDMLMKDMKNGTKTHQTACEAVKKKYKKP